MTLVTIAAFGLGLYLWMFFQSILHEVAHAVVGRMVGFPPFALVIGKGPVIVRTRAAGVDVRIHALPFFGGMVQAGFPLRGPAWRGCLLSIAGIASDAALLLLTINLAGFASGFFAMLAVYQTIILLGNAIPSQVLVHGMRVPNDGSQFIAHLTGRTSLALSAYEENVARYDPTFRLAHARLLHGDPSLLATFQAAEQHMLAGRHAEAVQAYLQLVAEPSVHPAEKALMLDRIACLPIIQGDKRFLPEAETWSRKACELVPACRTVHGTLGSILVEKGQAAAGLELLMPLTSEDNAPIDRALAACYAAKALHALGRTAEAGKWLQTARSYRAFKPVCSRIETELAPG